MRYPRWKMAFSENGQLLAVCKMCHRVETSKESLERCPSGCHLREEREQIAERKQQKKARKAEPEIQGGLF